MLPQMMPLPWLMVFVFIFIGFFMVSFLVSQNYFSFSSVSFKKVKNTSSNLPW